MRVEWRGRQDFDFGRQRRQGRRTARKRRADRQKSETLEADLVARQRCVFRRTGGRRADVLEGMHHRRRLREQQRKGQQQSKEERSEGHVRGVGGEKRSLSIVPQNKARRATVCPLPAAERQSAFYLPESVMPDPACFSCGACCATYRVDFHCSELAADDRPGVPEAMTHRLTETLVRMRGSDDWPPRCVALEGEIGAGVRCTIYETRPGPCREFAPFAPLGMSDDACERARRRHGLAPLAS